MTVTILFYSSKKSSLVSECTASMHPHITLVGSKK